MGVERMKGRTKKQDAPLDLPPSPPRRTGVTRYTPNTGTPALRAAIAAKLTNENGVATTPGDVVVSNGAKQAVWQALLAAVSPGDDVLIPAPYWVSYPEMATLAGANPVILPSDAADGFLLSPATLAAALTPRSRVLILCTPSNPSGAVYDRERLHVCRGMGGGRGGCRAPSVAAMLAPPPPPQQLAAVVASHPRLLVLSDEIYEYITYPPATHISFASLPGMAPRTLTVNGFSKAYAMTGWRLGYLAAPPPFAAAAAAIQSQTTSGASSIAQHAALAALGMGPGGGPLVGAMVDAFRERRDAVTARLRAIPGVSLPATPGGAFYAMPDVSALVGSGARADGFGEVADGDALCAYLLDAALVALVPGSAFGAPSCVRLSYAASLDTLNEAMDRIERALAPGVYTRPAQ